jgi:Rifampin ADP-ribosyl transferase
MGHNWLGPAFRGGTQYHGTELDLEPGDRINPGKSWISGEAADSGEYVHSTPDEDTAREFARFKGGRKVYEVEHTGPDGPDPNGGAARRSKGMRVVREVGGGQGGGWNWWGPAFRR